MTQSSVFDFQGSDGTPPPPPSELEDGETFIVSQKLADELSEKYSADLMTRDRARGVVTFQGALYVVTGVGGSGDGVFSVDLQRVVPLTMHKGPSFSYHEKLRQEFTPGTFYKNMAFGCKGKTFVCQGIGIVLQVEE